MGGAEGTRDVKGAVAACADRSSDDEDNEQRGAQQIFAHAGARSTREKGAERVGAQ